MPIIPAYTATATQPGSTEHTVDDRSWSRMTDDERTDAFLDEVCDTAPDWREHSTPRRTVNASVHGGDITVNATDVAHSDGTHWQIVSLDHGRFVLTPTEARELAAALTSAADHLDQLTPIAYSLA